MVVERLSSNIEDKRTASQLVRQYKKDFPKARFKTVKNPDGTYDIWIHRIGRG